MLICNTSIIIVEQTNLEYQIFQKRSLRYLYLSKIQTFHVQTRNNCSIDSFNNFDKIIKLKLKLKRSPTSAPVLNSRTSFFGIYFLTALVVSCLLYERSLNCSGTYIKSLIINIRKLLHAKEWHLRDTNKIILNKSKSQTIKNSSAGFILFW